MSGIIRGVDISTGPDHKIELQVTTLKLKTTVALKDLSDVDLLAQYEDSRDEASVALIVKGHLEQEIYRRVDERGARAIPDSTFVCEVTQESIYDQEAFRPLLEVFHEFHLNTCYTPEHMEPVAAKWTTVKVLALARRYGDAALAIVEQAKQPGRKSLKFQRREND